jgi:uncharacterized membrane protein (DUF485 family)
MSVRPVRTATDELPPAAAPTPPWDAMAAGEDFRQLLRNKTRFISLATAFFLVFYFALPVLSGYWPELMGRKAIGQFSLAYVFALAQFPMAWAVAALYLKAAARFDRDAAAVLGRHHAEQSKSIPEEEAE